MMFVVVVIDIQKKYLDSYSKIRKDAHIITKREQSWMNLETTLFIYYRSERVAVDERSIFNEYVELQSQNE
jgi:hypothetical protein